jgi:hypothetical protein
VRASWLAPSRCADGDAEVHRVRTENVSPRQALVTTTDEWIQTL